MTPLRTSMIVVDWVNKVLAFVAGLLIISMMVLTCIGIVARYFFNRPIFWANEVIEYSLLYITFLGTAWLLKKGGHVRVDMVVNELRPAVQHLINIIISFLGAVTTSVFTWYSVKVTLENYRGHALIPSNLDTPYFIVLSIIPVGYLFLTVEFLRQAFGNVDKLRSSRGKHRDNPLAVRPS